jgi:hypothetical protein
MRRIAPAAVVAMVRRALAMRVHDTSGAGDASHPPIAGHAATGAITIVAPRTECLR